MRYKPSKPMAIVGIFFGAGMIVFAVLNAGKIPVPFLIFWCLGVVAITAANVWSAFWKKGNLGSIVTERPEDVATQLEKLSSLHSASKLTDAEYAAAKAKLLS